MRQFLHSANQYYARTFDGVKNAVVFVVDADSQDVIYVNPFYEKFWGQTRESLYQNAHSWMNRIVDEDKCRIREAFVRMHVCGQFNQDYRIVNRDGEERWVNDRVHALSIYPEQANHRIGFVHDVTPFELEIMKIERLSDREREVLEQVLAGKGVTEIALQSGLDFRTIGTYRSRILQKLECRSEIELVKFAIRNRLMQVV